MRAVLIFIVAAFGLAACATPRDAAAPTMGPAVETVRLAAPKAPERTVILIGIDGLRWDAIDQHPAPALRALAARGVRAKAMIPAMPSVTFTNFYSIATGLHPDRHGIVGNGPYDRELGLMRREMHGESRWWGGEPIWVTAERQGVRAHTMFWLGSEAEIGGVRPSVWFPYEHEKPFWERIEQVFAWLDAPPAERPGLITLYFHEPDSSSHAHGPDSPETAAAIARVDSLIGALVRGLESRGLTETTDLVIVSDHGMAEVLPDQVIYLSDYAEIDPALVPGLDPSRGVGFSPYWSLFGAPTAIDPLADALATAHPHLDAYRRAEIPARFRMDHPTRGPDLFLLADPGWAIALSRPTGPDPRTGAPPRPIPGMHGFDRHARDMGATFIAAGPSFKSGLSVAPFDNVEVYGLLACALGLEPAETDGDIARVAHLLNDCGVDGKN